MNEALTGVVEQFYRAFQRRDGAAMGACYADNVRFSDPVFPDLEGERARAMWRMLCGQSKDLAIEFEVGEAHGDHVHAYWIARYTFTRTGRPVENHVAATLRVDGGRIVQHVDQFSFWRWSRQALGPAGWLLGWTPLLQRKLQATAAQSLDAFLKKQAAR